MLGREVVLPCDDIELDISSQLASLRFILHSSTTARSKVAVRLYDRTNFSADNMPQWEGGQSRYQLESESGVIRAGALVPGSYRIEIQGVSGHAAYTSEIRLEAGKELDLGAINFRTGNVEGSLQPLRGHSEVTCRRRVVGNWGEWGNDVSDQRSEPVGNDGKFRFADLPVGIWCLTATCDGEPVTNGVLVDLHADKTERVDLRATQAGSIRCRVHSGEVPVVGALAQYFFNDEGEMRPFFELNPRVPVLASDSEGRINMGSFFPGDYRITVTVGELRLNRQVAVAWGEQVNIEFDTSLPELAITLDLPEDWLARLTYLTFYPLDKEGPAAGLIVSARRTGMNTLLLRAPPSSGYVKLSLQNGTDTDDVAFPLTIRAGQTRASFSLPPGELVVRVGGKGGTWSLPEICAEELSTGKIPGRDSWLDHWPLESQGDGRWLARGIPAGATLRFQDQYNGHGQSPGARFVHFESGRLEVSWP